MNYIITALMIGLSGPVLAQSAEVKRACDVIDMLAPLIMEQRQAGAPATDLLPYANLAQGPVQQLAQNMINDAYAYPVVSEAAGKQNVGAQFKQKWVADCYALFE